MDEYTKIINDKFAVRIEYPDNDPDVTIDKDGRAWIHVNGRAYRYPYFDTVSYDTSGEKPYAGDGDSDAAFTTFRLIGGRDTGTDAND